MRARAVASLLAVAGVVGAVTGFRWTWREGR